MAQRCAPRNRGTQLGRGNERRLLLLRSPDLLVSESIRREETQGTAPARARHQRHRLVVTAESDRLRPTWSASFPNAGAVNVVLPSTRSSSVNPCPAACAMTSNEV